MEDERPEPITFDEDNQISWEPIHSLLWTHHNTEEYLAQYGEKGFNRTNVIIFFPCTRSLSESKNLLAQLINFKKPVWSCMGDFPVNQRGCFNLTFTFSYLVSFLFHCKINRKFRTWCHLKRERFLHFQESIVSQQFNLLKLSAFDL